MLKRTVGLASLLLASLTLLASAHAHRSFLVPSSTVLGASGKEWVTVDAARGNDLFYFNHNAMPVEGLVVTAPDGKAVKPNKVERFRYRSVIDVQLPQEGTWAIAVVDKGLRVRWEENGESRRWNGSREQFASSVPPKAQKLSVNDAHSRVETFVTTGKPTPVRLTGEGLEVNYLSHPNDLVAGEPATLAFHLDGKPVAGLKDTAIRGATRYRNEVEEMVLNTDPEGRVTFKWP